MPDSLKLKFGMHILKGISKKNSICDFVLYDERGELLTEMLTRITPDVTGNRFTIEQYTYVQPIGYCVCVCVCVCVLVEEVEETF